MRPEQTLARLVARYRGARRVARYCGLVLTLYNLTWVEQEEMEEINEMEETKKITNDVVFIPDPALMRCTDPELQCGEELYCYDYSSSSSSSPLDGR